MYRASGWKLQAFLRNVALCSNVRLEVSMFKPNDLNGNVGENWAQQIPLATIGIVFRKRMQKDQKSLGAWVLTLWSKVLQLWDAVRRNAEWLPWDVTHPTGTTQRRPRQSQFQPPRDKNATKIAAKALSAAVKGPAMASIWAWSTCHPWSWYELIRSHPFWIIGSHEL